MRCQKHISPRAIFLTTNLGVRSSNSLRGAPIFQGLSLRDLDRPRAGVTDWVNIRDLPGSSGRRERGLHSRNASRRGSPSRTRTSDRVEENKVRGYCRRQGVGARTLATQRAKRLKGENTSGPAPGIRGYTGGRAHKQLAWFRIAWKRPRQCHFCCDRASGKSL